MHGQPHRPTPNEIRCRDAAATLSPPRAASASRARRCYDWATQTVSLGAVVHVALRGSMMVHVAPSRMSQPAGKFSGALFAILVVKGFGIVGTPARSATRGVG